MSPRAVRTGPGSPGVQLPDGRTASGFLHELLLDATRRHPELRDAGVPDDAGRFRKTYAETIVRFEAARVASSARTDIAAGIADRSHAAFRCVRADGGAVPLSELLAPGAEPLAVRRVALGGRPGLRPRVPYRGRVYEGDALRELGDELAGRALATRSVAAALTGLASRAATTGGSIDLRGRRFAVLGAAAELSPARLLLEAGAELLWVDVKPPPPELLSSPDLAGALTVAEGADLLAAPGEIAATIARFAGDDGVDLVLAAYAPGSGREWRLTAAMNAIARALDPARLRGVGLYQSPTTPAELQDGEVEEAARRAQHAAGWQRALAAAGALGPSPFERGGVRVARAIVPVQGVSYQAAQYVEKTLAAERFAFRGTRDGAAPPRVSANVAPTTATRSLEHPLFEAGFLGAERFGIEVFAPDTTRALSGLLLLADLLPVGAAPATPAELFGRHVHGGIFAMPYAIAAAIRVAAVLGFAKRPRLLVDLLRRR